MMVSLSKHAAQMVLRTAIDISASEQVQPPTTLHLLLTDASQMA